MNCDEFEERLYDEDARSALLLETPVPEDLAEHQRSCPACRSSWTLASFETRNLARILILPAPEIHHARRPQPLASGRSHDRLAWIDVHVASWAAVGGIVGLGVLATATPSGALHWTGFWLGATIGLVAASPRWMRAMALGPWSLVRPLFR